MLIKQGNIHNQDGFSLIEMVVAIAILAFVTLALYSLFSFTLQVIWENKARVGASALANQKMEIAHNLPYNQVGTLTGTPTGTIPALENISLNGVNYTVQTQVIYIDDPHDGIQGAEPPNDDALAKDYKRVRIAVSWPTKLSNVPVVFLSDIVPQGIESEAGGGTLFIQVLDAYGQGIPADVDIINTSTGVYLVDGYRTNNAGEYRLSGTPPAVESYQIIVQEEGYSTDRTYETSLANPSPNPPHQTVFEGQLSSISFSIDLVSTINIDVQDENNYPLGNIPIQVQSQKIIGQDSSGQSIYKYNLVHQTNTQGQITLPEMEWGSYLLMASTTEWNIAESDPFQPVNVLPDTTTNIVLTLEPSDSHCLRVVVKDVEDQPLKDVSVRLYCALPGCDQTLTTATSGQAFFTNWHPATSTLIATSTGFVDYTDELLILNYMVEHVVMTQP